MPNTLSTINRKTPRVRQVASCLAVSSVLFGVAACGGDDDAPDEEPTFTKQEEALADTQWRKDNFIDSPFYLSNAQVNPQVWVPNDPAGALLPSDYDGDEVFWQMPACVVIPFTKDGPTEVAIGNDSFLELGGYEHTELGAAAAAAGYLNAAVESKDQTAAVARATGESEADAAHTVAGADIFSGSGTFSTDTTNCDSVTGRLGGYKIVDFSNDRATVDLMYASSSDSQSGQGAAWRSVLNWDGDDWKLDPQTFRLADELIDRVQRDGVDTVETSGFTQW